MSGIDRRKFLRRSLTAGGALLLTGCDYLSHNQTVTRILGSAEHLTQATQRFFTPNKALAPTYPKSAISPVFKPNGSTDPGTAVYRSLASNNFKDYQLEVGGLVQKPAKFSLADIKAMPARTQITRHDCVEGWSVIGQWTGVQLSHVLDQVQPKPNARYVVFRCADALGNDGSLYYESIGMEDAHHPQTLLAYELNGKTLPIPNGAPLRLRLPIQLGYKMAKYVMRVELVESFAHIEGGKGGFWEDRGYEWYAGI